MLSQKDCRTALLGHVVGTWSRMLQHRRRRADSGRKRSNLWTSHEWIFSRSYLVSPLGFLCSFRAAAGGRARSCACHACIERSDRRGRSATLDENEYPASSMAPIEFYKMPPSSRSASRSFAGNVSARRLERAKLREAAQRIPSPRRGSSILSSAFFDDALWSTILGFVSPADVAVFGRVCKAACACASSEWANWWLKAQSWDFANTGVSHKYLEQAVGARNEHNKL